MSDDRTLLRAYADLNSEDSFRILVERHFSMVYSTALRSVQGRHALAQELSQQVFTLMAKQAHRLKSHPLLAGWLYRCTRHVAARHCRDEARRAERERKAALLHEGPNAATTQGVDWEALRPQLDGVLEGLSEKDRNAVLLRYLGGHPHAEVARILGLSEDAARMRVERALEKLRHLLAKRGLRSTAEALAAFLTAQGAFAAVPGQVAMVTQASLSAATVGSAGASVGLFTLMCANKITVAACVACLVTAGIATYEYSKASDAEAARLLAETREGALRATTKTLQERVQAMEEERTRLSARAAAGAATGAASGRGRSQLDAYGDFLLANPQYSELSKKHYMATLPLKYGAFYRRLGLRREQIAAFEALLGEQFQLSDDKIVAARAKGVSLEDPSIAKLRLKEQDELQQRQKELLGEDGWAKLVEYSKAEPARVAVYELTAILNNSASPLSVAQQDSLEELIARNTPKAERSSAGKTVYPPEWGPVEAGAPAFLGQEQQAALKAYVLKRKMEAELGEMRLRSPELMQRSSPRGTP